MSKIADRILLIPDNVSITHEANNLVVKGPNGVLSQIIPDQISLIIESGKIKTEPSPSYDHGNDALRGTVNSLINNMIIGVTTGYQKTLEIKGVGYKVSLNNSLLDFSLGYSHNILLSVPSSLKVECLNSVKLIIKGADKQEVGWFAAKIRDFRRPSPFVKTYKGIFYQGETIKIKSGKKEAKK